MGTSPSTNINNTKPTALSPALIPIDSRSGQSPQGYNPFMTALKPDSHAYRETFGVNRPLDKPMFLGYRDNKALYGGSKLFILY